MGSYHYLFLLLMTPLLMTSSRSFAQGLEFKSKDNLIEERTSYNVFSTRHETFSNLIHVSFDVFFEYESSSGYIFRLKCKGAPNVYNLSYSNHHDGVDFNLNQEGKTNLLTISFDKKDFELEKWNKVDVLFNLEADSVIFSVKNKVRSVKNVALANPATPKIVFGRSEYLIDVPKFAIRNLIVQDNRQKFVFPLNESNGNTVHNDLGASYGLVDNPIWLINKAYYWTLRNILTSKSVAGVNFNPSSEEVYLLNIDSITIYNIRSGITKTMPYANKSHWFGKIGTNFIDTAQNKIYVYDLYARGAETRISCLDLNDLRWSVVKVPSFSNPLHHHSGYFDSKRQEYLVFGGFGDKHYSNDFYRYSIQSEKWERVEFSGDVISPRYFSAMGFDRKHNSLYVFGGMGSESGDQYVGRSYNYDLYKLDLEHHKIKKQWAVEMPLENVVPGRSMVVSDSSFYTLCYPEYFTNTSLSLYRFDLKDGSFDVFGDSIAIRSEKIKTNVHLFYSHKSHELCALIQEFENDDIASSIKIYTLASPPVKLESLHIHTKNNNTLAKLLIIGGVVMVSAIVILRLKRLKLANSTVSEVQSAPTAPITGNAVYLFGEFTVIDRNGRDINYMFSDKLQQLFIILLQTSLNAGITSQRLNDTLWPGKTADRVKNSRGVAINHLRKILKEMDGISLIYERKVYRIEFNNNFYCDYLHCLEIVSQGEIMKNKSELIAIISRGKFLKNNDLPMFDTFKQGIESKIESVLLYGMHSCYKTGENEDVIFFAEAIFEIDPFNDEALRLLIKTMNKMKLTEEAKKRYYLFIAEYKKSYGTEYNRPYAELT